MKEIRITRNDLLKSYDRLETRARYDLDYVLLTAGSAAICSFGFRMNSPSVIVGAMVVSPLLFAAVVIGAALFWRRWNHLVKNLITLSRGIAIGVGTSFVINEFFPTANGSELVGRITSSPSDYFFVALFSGLAGTFACFWPGIVEAITGIAISVALVPPVVMVGIGLANWDVPLITSSSEILLINIAGILVGSLLVVVGLNIYSKDD